MPSLLSKHVTNLFQISFVRGRVSQDIQVDLTTTMPKHGVEFEFGAAVDCDPKMGTLQTSTGKTIKFDVLIIATGAALQCDAVPCPPQGKRRERVYHSTRHARG